MTKQITYDPDFTPARVDIEQIRGDDVILAFPHNFGASTAVSEVRYFLRRVSDDAVMLAITLEDDSDQIDLTTDNWCQITIFDTNTQGITTSAAYEYAVEMVNTAARTETPIYGSHSFVGDVVHDDETAAPLSWATRQSLQDQIDDLWTWLALGSYVTVAAEAGGDTIQTADTTDAIFAATDDIYVTLDSGVIQTIAAANVDTVSDGLITLTGDTLDGVVSVGNVVRKGV